MGHLLYVFQKVKGRIIHRLVDSDRIPEGWVDAPNKIDGTPPKPQADPHEQTEPVKPRKTLKLKAPK